MRTAAIRLNDCFPIPKRPLRKAPVNDHLWPKVAEGGE